MPERNDTEKNGETGFDEDVEDGSENRIRDRRGQPNQSEHREHMNPHSTLQIMEQVLCDWTWCELAAQEIGRFKTIWNEVLHVSMDCGFSGETESEEQGCSMCQWITGSLEKGNLKNK